MAACPSVALPPENIQVSPRRHQYVRSRLHPLSNSARIAAVIEQSFAEVEEREQESRRSSLFFTNLMKDAVELESLAGLPEVALRLGYGEVPSDQVLRDARLLLVALRSHNLRPERIIPSADGGMAFSFAPLNDRRAFIEVLNDGDISAVTYFTAGEVRTEMIRSASDREAVDSAISTMKLHFEVDQFAPTAS